MQKGRTTGEADRAQVARTDDGVRLSVQVATHFGDPETVTAYARSADAELIVHRSLNAVLSRPPFVITHRATGLKVNDLFFKTRRAALEAADKIATLRVFHKGPFKFGVKPDLSKRLDTATRRAIAEIRAGSI